MSEADFGPEHSQRSGGAFRRLARFALGGLGTNSSAGSEAGSEIELYSGGISPADEILTGETVGDEFAVRPDIARLPEKLLEKNTLGQMAIGAEAYTVPWAMAVTDENLCFLNGRYTHQPAPNGTVQMKVVRTVEGYIVHVPRGYKYQPANQIPWVGAGSNDLLPVHKVEDGEA